MPLEFMLKEAYDDGISTMWRYEMEMIKSLEQQLVKINKDLPKLPAGLTKWLAEYAWLLVLIGVVLSVLSLFALVPLLLTVFGLTTLLGAQYGLAGYDLYGQLGWLNILLSVVSLLVVLYLEAIAINPLKSKLYRGWELIFIANVISLVLGVASNLVTVQIGSIVWSLLFAAIGFYVLFQVRGHFVAPAAHKSVKKPLTKTAEPIVK